MSSNNPQSTIITKNGWYYISCSKENANKSISEVVDIYAINAKSYELYRYVYFLDSVWTQPSNEFVNLSWSKIDLYEEQNAKMDPNLGYWINVYNYLSNEST
jgi:hypothetical protein